MNNLVKIGQSYIDPENVIAIEHGGHLDTPQCRVHLSNAGAYVVCPMSSHDVAELLSRDTTEKWRAGEIIEIVGGASSVVEKLTMSMGNGCWIQAKLAGKVYWTITLNRSEDDMVFLANAGDADAARKWMEEWR